MKNILILLGIILFSITIFSCNNDAEESKDEKEVVAKPEDDAKAMVEKIEKYSELANEAAADKVLDDKEIEQLKDLIKEIDKFEQDLDKKYSGDEASQEAIEKYFEDNEDDLEAVYEAFFTAMMAINECEGADKLNM